MTTRTPATLDDVLAAIEPGEQVAYSELLIRMKRIARPTDGVGHLIGGYGFRGGLGSGAEIVTWREPYWEDEWEGGWTEGTLWIKRRDRQETDTAEDAT